MLIDGNAHAPWKRSSRTGFQARTINTRGIRRGKPGSAGRLKESAGDLAARSGSPAALVPAAGMARFARHPLPSMTIQPEEVALTASEAPG